MIGLVIYLYWINIITFVLYALDKDQALRGSRRIPNAILLALSFIGGSLGALCAMLMFRHKTNQNSYKIIIPISLVIWSIVGFILLSNI